MLYGGDGLNETQLWAEGVNAHRIEWRGGGLVKRAASRFRLRFMYRQPFGDDRDCITGASGAGEPNSLSGRRSITASRNSVEKVAPRGLLARAHSVPGGARAVRVYVEFPRVHLGLVVYHHPHLQETFCTPIADSSHRALAIRKLKWSIISSAEFLLHI